MTRSHVRVSIRAPARGRPRSRRCGCPSGKVSIRAPARGRPRRARRGRRRWRFQSAPPRGGDLAKPHHAPASSVSIRAPARGRPLRAREHADTQEFQSAPPRGGDFCPTVWLSRSGCFNPRPREGATRGTGGGYWNVVVSIRAPARGRPPVMRQSCEVQQVSIRAPARGRRANLADGTSAWVFQSAPPRGGDMCGRAMRPGPDSFNPRPREGATDGERVNLRVADVSIRAPARGRRRSTRDQARNSMFQSAPPRGGDVSSSVLAISSGRFQSAPPRGGDVRPSWFRASLPMFQSAPPRGGDIRWIPVGNK